MHICSPIKLTSSVVNRIMWVQNEDVTNKQTVSKRGCSLAETSNSPSPPHRTFSFAGISGLAFRGKNTFKLIVKLLLKTNSKEITSYRHLPPNLFLAVCKWQISDQNQLHYRAFLLYTQNYIQPKGVGGWREDQLQQNHLVTKKLSPELVEEKKSSRICQCKTKNHS